MFRILRSGYVALVLLGMLLFIPALRAQAQAENDKHGRVVKVTVNLVGERFVFSMGVQELPKQASTLVLSPTVGTDVLVARLADVCAALGVENVVLSAKAPLRVRMLGGDGGFFIVHRDAALDIKAIAGTRTFVMQVLHGNVEPWGGEVLIKAGGPPDHLCVVSPRVKELTNLPGVTFYFSAHEAVVDRLLKERGPKLDERRSALYDAARAVLAAGGLSRVEGLPIDDEATSWYALVRTAARRGQLFEDALKALSATACRRATPSIKEVENLARWVLLQSDLGAEHEDHVQCDRPITPLGLYLLGGTIATDLLMDSDGDGLPDWLEKHMALSYSSADTDGDGCPDGLEILNARNPRLFEPGSENSLEKPPDVLTEQDAPTRVAYLTFDDGPSRDTTPLVLDVLRQKQVPATFFVVGKRALEHKQVLMRIKAEGHAIGNHSFDHHYVSIYRSPDDYISSLKRCEEVLFSLIDKRPKVTRPPGGSAGHLTPRYYSALAQHGYLTIDWDVSVRDTASPPPTPEEMIRIVLWEARKKDRDLVILMHDGSGHKATAQALGPIIDGLRERGYVFGKLDEEWCARKLRAKDR